MAAVYDLLYQLGVTANYTCFFHTAGAVSLCVEQPDRLLLVAKRAAMRRLLPKMVFH